MAFFGIQPNQLSSSLSGSLQPELDIKDGRISGKPEPEPDIWCIPTEVVLF